MGCKGVVTDNFMDKTLKAYLPLMNNLENTRNRLDLFLQDLKKIFPEIQSPETRINIIKDQDWGKNWRRFFRPDRVTQRLMVLPAWEPVSDFKKGMVIRIDPGPAFGTGQHPTTRMCLMAMEKINFSDPWTMLDVGTGSGILSIYASMLGASRVVAIDNDPEAIRWAEWNMRLNGLWGKIELSSHSIETLKDNFSLLAANLILGSILNLLPYFERILDHKGWLILSGILWEQVKEVKEKLAEYAFHKDQVLHDREWACIIASKR